MAAQPRRVLLRALPAVLAAVLAVGCSGGTSAPSDPTVAATPTPTLRDPAAWTEAVCAALVPVVVRLTAAPPLDLNAPEATRQAYLIYLTDGLAATDRARAALAAAGPAPTTDGDVIAEQVRGNVADLRTDLVDARGQVERVDPTSAVAVGRALVGGSKLIGALLNGAQVAGTINRDPVLHEAYDRSPSCAQLQRSGEPGAASTVEPTR